MKNLNKTSIIAALVLVQVRGFDIDEGGYPGEYEGDNDGKYEGDFLEDFGGSYSHNEEGEYVDATDCLCWFSVWQHDVLNWYLGTTFEMGADCRSEFANDSTSKPVPELDHYGTLNTDKEALEVIYNGCFSGYWLDCLCLNVGEYNVLKNGQVGEITAA